MTSSTGPGIGRSASPAIHRRGFGIRLSRARSFIARIVLVSNARARRTPPSLGGRGSRSRECARERCEDRQVCMQRDPIQPANAKRQQRQLVLEPKRRSSKQCLPRGRLPSRVRSSSASTVVNLVATRGHPNRRNRAETACPSDAGGRTRTCDLRIMIAPGCSGQVQPDPDFGVAVRARAGGITPASGCLLSGSVLTLFSPDPARSHRLEPRSGVARGSRPAAAQRRGADLGAQPMDF